MNSKSTSTHSFGSGQQPDAHRRVDYTTLTEGVSVEGQLSNGAMVESTVRCPECGRVGVMTEAHHDRQRIVHRGLVHDELLDGFDYCEVSAGR